MTLSVEQAPRVEATPRPRQASNRARFARSLRRHWQLYLLMVVPLVWFVVFKYIPMANAVIAFKNYNAIEGMWGSPWVGLRQLRAVLPQPGVLDPGEEHVHPAGYTLSASFPIADHPRAGAERGPPAASSSGRCSW